MAAAEYSNLRDSAGIRPPGRQSGASRGYVVIVVATLVVAAFLRTAALDRYPLPLHQDELTDIYDGYSLATTGMDRAGEPWPILVRGMGPGDYHPSLYALACAVTTGTAGFSVSAGRLPAAIFGMITVWVVFVVARSRLGRVGGVLALLFITFSPIHILYSRQAHMGVCLVPLITIVMMYLADRTIHYLTSPSPPRVRYTWVALVGLSVGFSTNTHPAERITGLLFAIFGAVVLLAGIGWRQRAWKRAWATTALFAVAVSVGAAPQLYAAIMQSEQFFARAGTAIYPLSNGVRWWSNRVLANLALNLDPSYLFSFGSYHALSVARLSVVAAPFLIVGAVAAVVRTVRMACLKTGILLVAIGISLVPAVISRHNPNPLHSAGVWSLYPLLAAMGAVALGRGIRDGLVRVTSLRHSALVLVARHRAVAVVGASIVGVAITTAGIVNVARYLDRPDLQAKAAQYQFVEIGRWLRDHGGDYDRVYIDADGLFGYLFVAAFSGMSPAEFQHTPREGTVSPFGWEKYHRFGRFHFKSADEAHNEWLASRQDGRWVVISDQGWHVEFAPERHAINMKR